LVGVDDISQWHNTIYNPGQQLLLLEKGVQMNKYRVYCNDKVIGEDLKAIEVEKLTGIKSKNVRFYAEMGQLKKNKYRVECDDITQNQIDRYEECCRAAELLKTGDAVIKTVRIKGNLHKRTVRV
jgi:hypothetical protein